MNLQSEKIRVIVKSRRVLAGMAEYDMPFYSLLGQPYHTRKAVPLYERVFQEEEKPLLEEAKKLATLNNLPLEIVDLGRRNFLSRWIFRLFSRFANPPSLIFTGKVALALTEKETPQNFPVKEESELQIRPISQISATCC
jgi:hypothetical protein